MNASTCLTHPVAQVSRRVPQQEGQQRRVRAVINEVCQLSVPAVTSRCSSGNTVERNSPVDGAGERLTFQPTVRGLASETSTSLGASVGSDSGNSESGSNIRVVIRVRPPVQRELKENGQYTDVVRVSKDRTSITLCEPVDLNDGATSGYSSGLCSEVYATQTFTFDYVHDKMDSQCDVYERSARAAVLSVAEGYNATLLAYGQTGAGKTYTMEGYAGEGQHGIIARAVEEIFDMMDSSRCNGLDYCIRASYMQIYNEVISDLLKPPDEEAPRSLTVRHTARGGVHVDGLSEWNVCSPRDVYYLMEHGTSKRATEATRMSELSSRSHAIFVLTVETEKRDPVSGSVCFRRVGKLNIVDLAGSEKVRQSGVRGQRLEEARSINKSLHELGNVISALAQRKNGVKDPKDGGPLRASHVPFRNSVLTSVLRDSLGGNCKTTLIVCVSPALESYAESLSTLHFANRAKNIRNVAVINEDVQPDHLQGYAGEYDGAQSRQRRQQCGLDAGLLSELQQSVRRVEEEREVVVEALQRSLRAHKREQEVRVQLQSRLEELEAVLRDSKGVEADKSRGEGRVTPDEYALGLEEIHHQWQVLQEEAMLNRYNQLLLKHRDIVVDLTSKLSERDEMIRDLREELGAHGGSAEKTNDAEIWAKQSALPNDGFPRPHGILSKEEAEVCLQRLRVQKPRCDGNGIDVWYRSENDPSVLLQAEEKILELLVSNHAKHRGCVVPHAALQTHQVATRSRMDEGFKEHLSKVAQGTVERVVHQQVSGHIIHLLQALKDAQLQLVSLKRENATLEELMDASRAQQLPEALEAISYTRRYFDGQQEEVRKAYEKSTETLRKQLDEQGTKLLHLSDEIDVMRVESQKALEYCTSTLQRDELKELSTTLVLLQEHVEKEVKRGVERALDCVMETSRDFPAGSGVSSSSSGTGPAACPNTSLQETSVTNARVQKLEEELRALRSGHAKSEEEWHRKLRERDEEISELLTRMNDVSVVDIHGKDAEMNFLKRSIEMQNKDRRALQTIMEQRIKPKVDSICKFFEGSALEECGEIGRLRAEAQALQGLVSAAVKAMQS